MRLKRFTLLDRLFHLGLMLTFMLQAATGLARMYTETGWGRFLASMFGGYHGAMTVHRIGGMLMLGLFVLHLIYLAVRAGRCFPGCVRGNDSLLFGLRDLKDFFIHLGWMLGLCDSPRFERWAYWEKFDYWAVFWGMLVLGGTGLLLADPVVSSRYLPGWGLNVAFWVHRIEALLAIGHVFIIHFAIAHIRPHNFPMDMAMFQGSVDLGKTRQERPGWIERLTAEGMFHAELVEEGGIGAGIIVRIFGCAVVLCGVLLLIFGLVNLPHITW